MTSLIDVVGTFAVAVADWRADRTGVFVDDTGRPEVRLGVDTAVSAATLVAGFAIPEMFLSAGIDAGQVAYDTGRSIGLPGYSIRYSDPRW